MRAPRPWTTATARGPAPVDVASWVERYVRLLLRLEGISTPAPAAQDPEAS